MDSSKHIITCNIGAGVFSRKPNYKKVRKIKCTLLYNNSLKFNYGNAIIRPIPLQTVQCNVSYSYDRVKSQCYHDVDIGTEYVNYARSMVVKLLLSEFNSSDGITLTADMPFTKNAMMNVSRPAVLQTYYGLDIECISPSQFKRVTYGSTSQTGPLSIDPRVYSTKPMPMAMYQLGSHLKKFVKEKFSEDNNLKNDDIFDCDFTHCTILTYNHHIPNINHKLSYHCDCVYDHNGTFIEEQNSQGLDTPVIIYSLGEMHSISSP